MSISEKSSTQATGWRRYLLNRYSVSGLGVLLLAGAGYWGWKTWRAPLDELEKYQIATVQRGDVEDLVTATGTMQPRDYVDVGAQVSGQLKKIHVEVGSVVEAGDLLAEIDPTVFRANVDARRALIKNQTATVLDRESQLALAELQFARQKNLIGGDATTLEAYQAAEAALRSAKAQLAASRASLEQTESTLRADEANLNYAKIYAPIAGVVVSITARQGQTLNANQQAPTILRIADLSTMTVQTQVSEADVGRLRPDMEVYFTTLGSRNRRWYGNLRKVEPTPTVTNNVVLFNALFDVANKQRNLLPQMTAQVFFVSASAKDVLYVPAGAVSGGKRGEGRRGGDESKDGKDAKELSGADKSLDKARDKPADKAGNKGGEAHASAEKPSTEMRSAGKSEPREAAGSQAGKSADVKLARTSSPPNATTNAMPPRPAGIPDVTNLSPEERRAVFEKLTPEQREAMREWRRAMREREQAEGGSGPGANAGPMADRIPRDSTRTRDAAQVAAKPAAGAGGARNGKPATGDKQNESKPADKLPSGTVWAGVGGQPARGQREATVKVVKADNSIEERKIQVGISNRIYVQVLSGLEEGDRVISGLKPPPGAQRAQKQGNQQGGQSMGAGGMGTGGMGAGGMGNAGTGQGARAR